MRILGKVCVVLALVVLLLPATVDAQRICLSFASETNVDGPNFLGLAGPFLNDGGPADANGVVDVIMVVQPFCDIGPVVTRPVQMFIYSAQWAYMQNAFVFGNTVHNWAFDGNITFIDTATNTLFLSIDFSAALLTAWSPSAGNLLSTATWQDSSWTDPNIQFTSGPELDNIMIFAGFPPNLINQQPDFAFTLTNIRDPGGTLQPIPINPFTGNFLQNWIADGSFSASAGF